MSSPYVDPSAVVPNSVDPVEKSKPSFMYFPSQPTKEELDNIFSLNENAVVLSGSATGEEISPVVGKIDIGESVETYIFHVSLPGVARETFTFNVAPDGEVKMHGVSTTGEKTVFRNGMRFEMRSQNLCPSGPFSIAFKLPGPVNPQQLTVQFNTGLFECEVKKNIAAN